jgi:putative oxidoreductase
MVKKIRDLIRGVTKRLKWLPPLAARVLLGVVFIQSGWGKLHNLDGTAENFAGWHIPFPHFNAVLASGTEFLGGLAILLGLGTRLAAVPLIVVMGVAILTAKWPQKEDWTDFFGWDETAYAVMFLWLAIAGAGKASIDHFLGKKLNLTVEETV